MSVQKTFFFQIEFSLWPVEVVFKKSDFLL